MPFLTGVVEIRDSIGTRIDKADANGNRAPIALKLGAGLAASSATPTGGITEVTLSTTGGSSGSIALANFAVFRALADGAVADGQVIVFQSPPSTFLYLANEGAGYADDESSNGQASILKRTATSLGSNGRAFNVNAPTVPTIAALRLAVAGKQPHVHVQGFASIGDGGGGTFDKDAADVTSTDDVGTIVVAGTVRYKRRYAGNIHATWFGIKGDGTNEATLFQTTINRAAALGKTLEINRNADIGIGAAVTLPSNLDLFCPGEATIRGLVLGASMLAVLEGVDVSNVVIEGFFLKGKAPADPADFANNDRQYAIRFRGTCSRIKMKRIRSQDCSTSIAIWDKCKDSVFEDFTLLNSFAAKEGTDTGGHLGHNVVFDVSGSVVPASPNEITGNEFTNIKYIGAPPDLTATNTLLNEIKADYNAHRVLTAGPVHGAADNTNTVTVADATDAPTRIALANDLRAKYQAHRVLTAGGVHGTADNTNTIVLPPATDDATAVALTIELKAKYNAHRVLITNGVHTTADNTNVTTSPNPSAGATIFGRGFNLGSSCSGNRLQVFGQDFTHNLVIMSGGAPLGGTNDVFAIERNRIDVTAIDLWGSPVLPGAFSSRALFLFNGCRYNHCTVRARNTPGDAIEVLNSYGNDIHVVLSHVGYNTQQSLGGVRISGIVGTGERNKISGTIFDTANAGVVCEGFQPSSNFHDLEIDSCGLSTVGDTAVQGPRVGIFLSWGSDATSSPNSTFTNITIRNTGEFSLYAKGFWTSMRWKGCTFSNASLKTAATYEYIKLEEITAGAVTIGPASSWFDDCDFFQAGGVGVAGNVVKTYGTVGKCVLRNCRAPSGTLSLGTNLATWDIDDFNTSATADVARTLGQVKQVLTNSVAGYAGTINLPGTGPSTMAGALRVASAAAPLVALDVTGDIRSSTGSLMRPDNAGVAISIGNGSWIVNEDQHSFKTGAGTSTLFYFDNTNLNLKVPNFNLDETLNWQMTQAQRTSDVAAGVWVIKPQKAWDNVGVSAGNKKGGAAEWRLPDAVQGGTTHGYFSVTNEAGSSFFVKFQKTTAGALGIGFFNVAPVAQQADVGALTDNTTGTADGIVADVGAAFSQATLNNNFADLIAKINGIRTTLRNLGLMA